MASSLISTTKGQISVRRIDVRGDRSDAVVAAVPHELAHVIFADLFASHKVPRWADEGVAVLQDTATKQQAHRQDLLTAIHDNTSVKLQELFALQGYPDNRQRAAFYGESASVVKFLVQRGSAAQFMRFVSRASDVGYDKSLNESYKIENLAKLERLWMTDVLSGH